MNKLFVTIFLLLILALIGISIFGPWDTYRIPGEGDMLGRKVSVVDLPTWIGDGLRLFRKDILTQAEARKEQEEWYNAHPKEKAEKEKYERWLMARGQMFNKDGCIVSGKIAIEKRDKFHSDIILVTETDRFVLIPSPDRKAKIYEGGVNRFRSLTDMEGKEMTVVGDLIDELPSVKSILVKQIYKGSTK